MCFEFERVPENSPGSGLGSRIIRQKVKPGELPMVRVAIEEIIIVFAVVAIALAIRKWHAIQDRHLIYAVIGNALKERKALWSGILTGVFYLIVYMILGGKGGRIHVLFGRIIWNTTPGEIFTGFVLAILVMTSMALFVYGVQVMGGVQSGKKSGAGFFGSLLALLAAFCP